MDELKDLGFSFCEDGNLSLSQGEALSKWLTEDRNITDVSVSEIKEAFPEIVEDAKKIYRENCLEYKSEIKDFDAKQVANFLGERAEWIKNNPPYTQ